MNPRQEALDRVDGAYEVRVLEPSPPPVTESPWFADDPVARGDSATGKPVVSPVTTGDLTWAELCRDDSQLAEWCAARWLGPYRRMTTPPDADVLARTRAAWHTLGEHVLAPARYAANGKIGLRFTRNGFGTPWFAGPESTQLRIEGDNIVRGHLDASAQQLATSIASAAAFAMVEPGAPVEVYKPTTALDLDAPLAIDPAAATFLGNWFGFGASVLEELRAEATAVDAPARVQLWPEHFDLSFDTGDDARAARGTFGASPGDAAHAEPYLYVTHWSDVPPNPFWNDEHFDGASLPFAGLVRADDQRSTALRFLRAGRAVLDRTGG